MSDHNSKFISLVLSLGEDALVIPEFDKEEAVAYEHPEENTVVFTSQGRVISSANPNIHDVILTVSLPYTYMERTKLKNFMDLNMAGAPLGLEMIDDGIYGETEKTVNAKFITTLQKSKAGGADPSTRVFKVYCPNFKTTKDNTLGGIVDKYGAAKTLLGG